MIRRLALVALAALLPFTAPAQAWLIGRPVAAGYTGPGDYANFTAWWGLRAYDAAKAAAEVNALDLRRVSDNATCTVKVATDGTLDLTVGTVCNGGTQTVTAWIGASTARVSKIYDQVAGNACGGASCDLVQATAGNQPQLVLTGGGGSGTRPYLETTTDAMRLLSANNYTPNASADRSLAVMANRAVGQRVTFLVAMTTAVSINASLNAETWASSVIHAATDATWHVGIAAKNSNVADGSVMAVDGAETAGTSNTDVTVSAPHIMDAVFDGTTRFGEGGFQDNSVWSAGIRTNLCHNMRVYWGTGGSC